MKLLMYVKHIGFVITLLFTVITASASTGVCGTPSPLFLKGILPRAIDSTWKFNYVLADSTRIYYSAPKQFGFITDVPKDLAAFTKNSFSRRSLGGLAAIAASSALLIAYDQEITDETQRFFKRNNISARSDYDDLFAPKLQGKHVSIISVPRNINTVFYTLGQGYPALMVGGGLYLWGRAHHDVRAVSTASQLTESFISLGIATQVVKRITGRQTPIRSTEKGGKWTPFPPFMKYQKETPSYDAFPSGHLATVVCAFTILAENYPEKKWIKPAGYVMSALVAASMLNNGVHWAGDYPLAIGIGIGFGKTVAAFNRKIERPHRVIRD